MLAANHCNDQEWEAEWGGQHQCWTKEDEAWGAKEDQAWGAQEDQAWGTEEDQAWAGDGSRRNDEEWGPEANQERWPPEAAGSEEWGASVEWANEKWGGAVVSTGDESWQEPFDCLFWEV